MGRPFISHGSSEWHSAAIQVLKDKGMEITAKVEDVVSWLDSQRKTSYRLSVLRVEDDTASDVPALPTASRAGGTPYLMPGEAWPTGSTDVPLTFLYQINLSNMPREVRAVMGHDSGLFQLFVDEELPGCSINEDTGYYLVRVLAPEQLTTGEVNTTPPPDDVDVYPACDITGTVKLEDLPNYEDLREMLPGDLKGEVTDKVLELLESDNELFKTESGDKLAGWPHWCQGPEWGKTEDGERYVHVFQFEGQHVDMSVGDSGTLVVQRHPRDPNQWRVGWACC